MEADQAAAVGGQTIEQGAAGRGGLIRHMVGHWPPVRMLERDQRMGQSVAANQQAVGARHLKRYMALGVAGRG